MGHGEVRSCNTAIYFHSDVSLSTILHRNIRSTEEDVVFLISHRIEYETSHKPTTIMAVWDDFD
jgi:hypothetical protein